MKSDEHQQEAPPAVAGSGAPAAAPAPAPAPAEAAESKKHRPFGRKDKSAAQVEALTREKEEAEQARAVLQDRLLRLQADFENYRKRTLREKSELFRTANEDLVSELLPVLDHFDMALEAAGRATSPDAIAQGVRMVREQLQGVLTRFGLQPLDAAGQSFDPSVHEAISHLASEQVAENGVIAQTRRGYRLGEKLLRPVQVVVSSGAPAAAAPPPAAEPTAPATEE